MIIIKSFLVFYAITAVVTAIVVWTAPLRDDLDD